MALRTGRNLLKPLSKHGLKSAKKKAPRKVYLRQPSENEIHMKAWQWVKEAHPDLLIFHVPNGEHRNIATANKLKRMGVLPGVADFLAFTHSRHVAIELKDTGGKQSSDQSAFDMRWGKTGGEYYICRSLIDFKSIINAIALF
jgi:hypothetical protein